MITLRQITLSSKAWNEIMQNRFSPTIAYRLGKYYRLIEQEVKDIEEQRMKLVTEEFGTKNEDGTWRIEADRVDDFIGAFEAFLETDSGLKRFEGTVDGLVQDLEKNPSNSINPSTLMAIEPFFVEKIDE